MSKEINVKGPDFVEKQPTPYLYEAPANVPFPEKLHPSNNIMTGS